MEKHFLSHSEVFCSTWAICGYNIDMPFLANVVQRNLRSVFPLYFLFQQCGHKNSLSQKMKPCTSDLNVCVDTTLKEGSVEKLRTWRAPRSIHSSPHRDHKDDGNVEIPEVTYGQRVLHGLQRFQANWGSENHTCSKSCFPPFSRTCNSWFIAAVGCGSGLEGDLAVCQGEDVDVFWMSWNGLD